MILRAIYGDPHHHIGLTEAKQAIGVTSETMELETSGRVLCLLRRFAVQEARGSKAQKPAPLRRNELSLIIAGWCYTSTPEKYESQLG